MAKTKEKPAETPTAAAAQSWTEKVRAEMKPKQIVDMGNGLELWLVDLALLREQDVNARAMSSDAFLRLTDTVQRDKRLESLPLCAVTEKGLEIVSGHHRTRAARKAGITELWVLVDVTGLTRDQIKAKQLAHNAIQGKDNVDLVQQIFDSIKDVDAKIEAFVMPDMSKIDTNVTITSKELNIELNVKLVTLAFLPVQKMVFEKAIERLKVLGEVDDVYLAALEEYDAMVAASGKASEAYNITSMPTLFAKMAEVIIADCDAKLAEKAAKAA